MRITLKQIIFTNSRPWRIAFGCLFSLNIILPGLSAYTTNHPVVELILTALAYWLHLLRMNLFAVALLLMALYLNMYQFIYY